MNDLPLKYTYLIYLPLELLETFCLFGCQCLILTDTWL